ncbi:Mo-dependent nitrogenase C-terminal domain-containing protein [Leptolyngbya sp. AN03gr2]|uniref:Mo-dependent nitrogenase C-terminal domain-containing protein n=1 Tax=unclassified Leptolyngbya TaxID=2650499 RepID=UPI003D31B109
MSFRKLDGFAQERDRHDRIAISGWVSHPLTSTTPHQNRKPKFAPLAPLRRKLDNLQVHNSKLAHFLAEHIPAQCPFERDVKLFGQTLFHIPPMCKLNPLYEEVVALRFRALCYLADECGEDISQYC